jgi:hypothetical protein
MPNTDTEDPSRAKLRNDNVAPRLKKSSTDRVDPKRTMPKTDNEEPNRRKLRRDNVDPKPTKSSTDRVEPKRL